jgi:hypothetical protein
MSTVYPAITSVNGWGEHGNVAASAISLLLAWMYPLICEGGHRTAILLNHHAFIDIWSEGTCPPAKVGAPVGHVQVDGARAIVVLQHLVEVVNKLVVAGVGERVTVP